MTIQPAKASSYNNVMPECIYDYIRKYTRQIHSEVEPEEDGTGNSFKEKQERFVKCNKTRLKQIAAQLETVCKELDYMLYGMY